MEKNNEIIVKQPIVISYSLGATINIGNYQSIRVNVGVQLPIYNKEKFDEAYSRLQQKVETLLEKEIEKYVKKYTKSEDDNVSVEYDLLGGDIL
ncbi:MAG: hypothetical protein QXW35_03435 [Candidatus Aenigmatarchaeota archaeon]